MLPGFILAIFPVQWPLVVGASRFTIARMLRYSKEYIHCAPMGRVAGQLGVPHGLNSAARRCRNGVLYG